MNRKNSFLILVTAILVLGLTLSAADMEKVEKTFAAKKTVRLQMVSGDCLIKTGGTRIEVKVNYDYPKDQFTPKFNEQTDALILSEAFSGGSCSGSSRWEVVLSADTTVEFASASGDFEADGVKSGLKARSASGNIRAASLSGRIEIHTASGDVDLRKINGRLAVKSASGDISVEELTGAGHELSAASGDISLGNLKGDCQISCASGSITGDGLSLTGESQFKSASGDLRIKLASAPTGDITLASASGDASLDFNGLPMTGSFEMTARKDRPLTAPFKFDTEEEFEKNGKTYIKKTAVRQGSSPHFVIKSASGKVEVK